MLSQLTDVRQGFSPAKSAWASRPEGLPHMTTQVNRLLT